MVEQLFLPSIAFVGLLISMYFRLVSSNKIAPDARFIPSWCRMETGTCTAILSAREARLFGIPNFELGSFFYLIIMTTAFMELPPVISSGVIIVSGGTVVVSAYLAFRLISVLRVTCVLCFTSHVANLLIFLLLLL
jgi:uncharacterized membrane protein